MDVEPAVYNLTSNEKRASEIVFENSSRVYKTGYGLSRSISGEMNKLKDKYPVNGRVDLNEILRLCNGSNSALDIKFLLDGQLKKGETELESVVNTLNILKELGYLI